jgi:hypothetical protein
MGKRRAIAPQAVSLEAEVDNYLAIPASSASDENIIQFWQVCDSCVICQVLTAVGILGPSESVANTV